MIFINLHGDSESEVRTSVYKLGEFMEGVKFHGDSKSEVRISKKTCPFQALQAFRPRSSVEVDFSDFSTCISDLRFSKFLGHQDSCGTAVPSKHFWGDPLQQLGPRGPEWAYLRRKWRFQLFYFMYEVIEPNRNQYIAFLWVGMLVSMFGHCSISHLGPLVPVLSIFWPKMAIF